MAMERQELLREVLPAFLLDAESGATYRPQHLTGKELHDFKIKHETGITFFTVLQEISILLEVSIYNLNHVNDPSSGERVHNRVFEITSDILQLLEELADGRWADNSMYPTWIHEAPPNKIFGSSTPVQVLFPKLARLRSALGERHRLPTMGLATGWFTAYYTEWQSWLDRIEGIRQEYADLCENEKSMRIEDFIYRPLPRDQTYVRLCRFVNGGDGALSCDLETYAASDCPAFDAISYEWSPPDVGLEKSRFLYVNGLAFTITRNLHDCLSAIQTKWQQEHVKKNCGQIDRSEPRYIWADQLCINQKDSVERSTQVAQMDTIFMRAQKVIAWLGRDTNLARYLESLETNDSQSPDYGRTEFLTQCSFWTRLWIQQEIVLARTVEFTASNVFVSASELRRNTWLRAQNTEPALNMLLEGSSEKRNQISLMEALLLFSDKKCSDVRDKIYGLQGTVRREERVHIDYDVGVEVVFERAVRAVVGTASGPLPEHFERARRNALMALGGRMGLTREVVDEVYASAVADL